MTAPVTLTATGLLLGIKGGGQNIQWESLAYLEAIPLSRRGWSWLMFSSSEPLLNEPSSPEPFVYPFLLRSYRDHLVLLGRENALVEILVDRFALRPQLFSPTVGISSLVNELVEQPGTYVLSAVYAKVEGHGQALRSVVLYGADIGSAKLFRDIRGDLQCYRVGLRRNATGQEIMSIGSRGEVGFIFNGLSSLERVDRALGFLSNGGYIDWNRQLAVTFR